MSQSDSASVYNGIKSKLDNGMEVLVTVGRKYSLPGVDREFLNARENLAQQDFSIVVFGEQKNGKSSFVNALIGRKLLPVDVSVSTSQAFRISNSEKESFYLVFDGGHKEQIKAEELVKYGSESADKLAALPILRGRKLLWIEVNVPTAFLPSGVHVLDTPGLGAIYPEHASVTKRCLNMADAAIFIKHCESPIKEDELNFISEAFDITRNIMFVLNKIDTVDLNVREELIARNSELLNKEFGEKTGGRKLTLWPFNSKLLLSTASETDKSYQEEDKEDSGYSSLLKALTSLISSTVGQTSCCMAYDAAANYLKSTVGVIAERLKNLDAKTAEDKQELQLGREQKKADFIAKWGPNGSEKRDILRRLSDIISGGESAIASIFHPSGRIAAAFNNEIDNLNENIDDYAEKLPKRLCDCVENEWNDVVRSVAREIASLGCAGGYSSISVHSGGIESVKLPSGGQAVLGHGLMGLGAASALITLGVVASGGTLAAVLPFVGGALGLFAGNEARIARQKTELHQAVSRILSKLQAEFMFAQGGGTQASSTRVFSDFRRQVEDSIEERIADANARFNEEIATLEAQAKMNAEDNAKCRVELNAAKNELISVQQSLKQCYDDMAKQAEKIKF